MHARNVLVLVLLIFSACGDDSDPPQTPTVAPSVEGSFLAGVAEFDITPPIGVPLAGYGGGGRRLWFPDLNPWNYHTYLHPSEGVLDPIYGKALVLSDGETLAAILTLDGVAAPADLTDRIHAYAVEMGSTLQKENLLVAASHTHSGPGAVSDLTFWELLGADKLVPEIRDGLAKNCAKALVKAEENLAPARFGAAIGHLPDVTQNRRSWISPFLALETVDDELGVIRIDHADGTPMAVLWNFGIHGTALDSNNQLYSADIMGAVSTLVAKSLGVPALFVNAAEGDIVPKTLGLEGIQELSPIIADKIMAIFDAITTESAVTLAIGTEIVPFGEAAMDLSLDRAWGSYSDLSIAVLFDALGWNPGFSIPLPEGWFETEFRFTALRINDTVISSVPGEAIHQVGLEIKQDGYELGFGKVFVFGLTNGHMSYITTEKEYWVGDYEALATFFGPETGENVRVACRDQMKKVQP